MSKAQVAALMAIWTQLKSCADRLEPARLGYSGCYIQNEREGRWVARNTRVFHDDDGRVECREDTERRFEAAILVSAPAGSLPRI